MFIFISELLIFISIIWAVTYSFEGTKSVTNVDNIKINELITQLNGKPYDKIYYNTKTDKEKSIIYKEIILEFKSWAINTDFCNLLNKK